MRFEELCQSSIAIGITKNVKELSFLIHGITDPQVASTKRLDVFCCCCCSLIRKNIFVCLFGVHKTYKKFLLALIRQSRFWFSLDFFEIGEP